MRRLRLACCLAACALVAPAAPVRGAFHFWEMKEIFTSADGTVQFVEFFTTFSGQEFLSGHTLTANSDGVIKTFTFPAAIPVVFPNTTANKHFIVATDGFGALAGGVTPDYSPLPSNFFDPDATTITFQFANFYDTLVVSGASIPKDGVNSLTDSNTSQGGPDNMTVTLNSPTNFAGAAGSVNVGGPAFDPGDFNESGMVTGADLGNWEAGFGMQGASVEHDDGDADDDNDVDGADFLVWQQDLEAAVVAAGGAVPEPATGWLAGAAACGLARLCRRNRHELAGV